MSADRGFAYTRDQFQQLVEDTLRIARGVGASDAGVEVSEGVGLSVSVRKGALENVERNRDKSIGVTVYLGQRRGNASTSDFSRAALEQTVRAAYDIARFTAEDPAAGLPDETDLAPPEAVRRDLDLCHPWSIDAQGAAEIALRCEAAAFATDRRIVNSEGAGVSAQQSHFVMGNTRGFRGGYASSRHGISVSPIAVAGNNPDDMQRDYWYTSMRDASELADPEAVGRYAAGRALSRLAARKIGTREVPVLFESTLASGLLGAYVQATSGGSLYRKASFLEGCLGQPAMAGHLDVHESHVLGALRRGESLDGRLDSFDLAVRLPGPSWERVTGGLRTRRAFALVEQARVCDELVSPARAASLVSDLAPAIQAATPTHQSQEPDLMLRRLLREALLHSHKPRRHHAALLIAASPYAPAAARRFLDLAADQNDLPRRPRLDGADAGRDGGRREQVFDLSRTEKRPTIRSRALVNVGLGGPLSAEQSAKVAEGYDEMRPLERHSAMFALGMAGAPELQRLAAHDDPETRGGAQWWIGQGPAIHDQDAPNWS